MSGQRHWSEGGPQGVSEAVRALRMRKGPLTEADIPTKPQPFPGKKIEPVPGQLDIFGELDGR